MDFLDELEAKTKAAEEQQQQQQQQQGEGEAAAGPASGNRSGNGAGAGGSAPATDNAAALAATAAGRHALLDALTARWQDECAELGRQDFGLRQRAALLRRSEALLAQVASGGGGAGGLAAAPVPPAEALTTRQLRLPAAVPSATRTPDPTTAPHLSLVACSCSPAGQEALVSVRARLVVAAPAAATTAVTSYAPTTASLLLWHRECSPLAARIGWRWDPAAREVEAWARVPLSQLSSSSSLAAEAAAEAQPQQPSGGGGGSSGHNHDDSDMGVEGEGGGGRTGNNDNDDDGDDYASLADELLASLERGRHEAAATASGGSDPSSFTSSSSSSLDACLVVTVALPCAPSSSAPLPAQGDNPQRRRPPRAERLAAASGRPLRLLLPLPPQPLRPALQAWASSRLGLPSEGGAAAASAAAAIPLCPAADAPLTRSLIVLLAPQAATLPQKTLQEQLAAAAAAAGTEASVAELVARELERRGMVRAPSSSGQAPGGGVLRLSTPATVAAATTVALACPVATEASGAAEAELSAPDADSLAALDALVRAACASVGAAPVAAAVSAGAVNDAAAAASALLAAVEAQQLAVEQSLRALDAIEATERRERKKKEVAAAAAAAASAAAASKRTKVGGRGGGQQQKENAAPGGAAPEPPPPPASSLRTRAFRLDTASWLPALALQLDADLAVARMARGGGGG